MGMGSGASRQAANLAACLLLSLHPGLAQNAASRPPADPSARTLLIEKAQAFEARGRPDLSIQIWQQVLAADPKNTVALTGLAEDLKLTGSHQSVAEFQDAHKPVSADPGAHAKQETGNAAKPPAAAKSEQRTSPDQPSTAAVSALLQLDSGIGLLENEISFDIASGQPLPAADLMVRVQAHYARLHTDPPIAVATDNASLLFATANDRALYPVLMSLGDRPGLTLEQRQTLQNIWVNWSIRRAAAAIDDGIPQRSIDILDAAVQAFPDRIALRIALAGACAQAGRTGDALALYKTLLIDDAAVEDLERAIDTALTAGDTPQAGQWLRPALARFPHNPDLLSLASSYEQAIGNGPRAAEFYQASLAAMPTTPHTEKLAHMAVYPGMHGPADQDASARRSVTAADLPHLLDPSDVPFAKISYLPSLTAGLPPSENAASPQPPAPTEPAPASEPSPQATTKTRPAPAPAKVFPPSASEGQTPTAPVFVPRQ